jgi:hypothetical protein
LAVGVAVLSGCGGGRPFVLTDFREHQMGNVEVCYDHRKTTMVEAQTLANGVCDQYDRVAQYTMAQTNQCNWLAPDIALFECVARDGETPLPFVQQKALLRRNSTGN